MLIVSKDFSSLVLFCFVMISFLFAYSQTHLTRLDGCPLWLCKRSSTSLDTSTLLHAAITDHNTVYVTARMQGTVGRHLVVIQPDKSDYFPVIPFFCTSRLCTVHLHHLHLQDGRTGETSSRIYPLLPLFHSDHHFHDRITVYLRAHSQTSLCHQTRQDSSDYPTNCPIAVLFSWHLNHQPIIIIILYSTPTAQQDW